MSERTLNIVGVDIGGTFTDLVGCVDGEIVTSKTSTVPADPTRGVAESLALAHCRHAGARRGAAWLDHRHQHGAGAQGRAHRADHYARLPRCLRDRARQPHRGVQSVLPPAQAAGTARAHLRGRRADRRRRRGADPARRGRGRSACRRRSRPSGIEAVAVCLLHAYANPAARAPHRRDRARRRSRPVRHAVARDRARVPRIRAHLDHRAQRLRRTARASAISAGSRPLRDGEVRRQDQHHALERRRDVDRSRAGAAGRR